MDLFVTNDLLRSVLFLIETLAPLVNLGENVKKERGSATFADHRSLRL